MPRTPLVPEAKVLEAVAAKAGGATSAEIAAALKIPERTARRYLAALYAAHALARTAGYSSDHPPVFYYRYHVAPRRRR